MKKLLTLLILSLMLTACGGGATTEAPAPEEPTTTEAVETTEPEATEPEAEEVEEETEPETEAPAASNEIVIGQPITLGDYEVVVQSYSLVSDYDGNDVLKIVYDWTNNSDEDASATWTFSWTGFQNGLEVDRSPFSDEIDYGIGQKDLRAGATQEGVERGFELTDDSSIEIELKESFSFSDEKFETVVDPTELE